MMFFGLYSKLIVGIAIALALSAGFWKAYHSGYKARDAIAQVEEAQRTAQALEASEAARAKEQQLTRQVETERGKYAQQLKNTRTVAAAGIGMRDLQQALTGPVAAASASAAARTDDAARARVVVSECAKTVQGLAALLDERNQQLIALQAYVAAIQPKPQWVNSCPTWGNSGIYSAPCAGFSPVGQASAYCARNTHNS